MTSEAGSCRSAECIVLQRLGVANAAQELRAAHLVARPKEVRRAPARRCDILAIAHAANPCGLHSLRRLSLDMLSLKVPNDT